MTPRARQYPLGDRIRLAELAQDPYPHYRQLQAHEPVSWVGETQQWYVTRREDILDRALRHGNLHRRLAPFAPDATRSAR